MSDNNIKSFTSAQIRYFAYLTMLIDHIGHFIIGRSQYFVSSELYPYVHYLFLITRIIGRVSFPLFCLLLVEGINHTKNIYKYLGRILLLAIICEPIFNYAFDNSLFQPRLQNVIFSLFLSGLALYILKQLPKLMPNDISRKLFSIALICSEILLASYLHIEYATEAILLVLFIDYYLNHNMMSNNLLLVFFVILSSGIITNIINAPMYILSPGLWITEYIEPAFGLQLLGTLSVIFIKKYNRTLGKLLPGYVYYSFYPIHLLVLKLISNLIFTVFL